MSVGEPFGTSVEELLATMKERNARIPSEIGAFVALEVCEAILDAPAEVTPSDIRIADDGTIELNPKMSRASSEDAARSVVSLLSALLVAAGAGVPKSRVAILDAAPSDLASLRDDLEASLVPLNRAAARRVLSRMLRDVRKPLSSRPPPREEAPRDAALDAELVALLGGKEPAPAQTKSVDHDATISEASAPISDEETLQDKNAPRERPPRKVRAPAEPFGNEKEKEKPRRGVVWIVLVLAICATVLAFAWMRPDVVDSLLGRESEERTLGTLIVESRLPDTQVLLFVGRGPALARDLEVGAGHEFVVLVDGRAATRSVLPAGAEWQREEGRARYELAIQASTESVDRLSLGASALGEVRSGGDGELGDVRVVTNPPGAKVYVVLGVGPAVTAENVPAGEPIEVLVYHPEYDAISRVIGPSDWEGAEGSRSAHIVVHLSEE